MPKDKIRCGWCTSDDAYIRYHDDEWGVPVRDDRVLFEFLVLEGAQAGLSWLTILRKRENFRKAFASFSAEKIARFTDQDKQRLLADEGIIRNRLKIDGTITNARLFLEVAAEHGDFATYLWSFIDNKPIVNAWERLDQVPATTPESDRISKELKKRGFKFVGSTIVYAYMQAIGMVNDHLTSCFRYKQMVRDGK